MGGWQGLPQGWKIASILVVFGLSSHHDAVAERASELRRVSESHALLIRPVLGEAQLRNLKTAITKAAETMNNPAEATRVISDLEWARKSIEANKQPHEVARILESLGRNPLIHEVLFSEVAEFGEAFKQARNIHLANMETLAAARLDTNTQKTLETRLGGRGTVGALAEGVSAYPKSSNSSLAQQAKELSQRALASQLMQSLPDIFSNLKTLPFAGSGGQSLALTPELRTSLGRALELAARVPLESRAKVMAFIAESLTQPHVRGILEGHSEMLKSFQEQTAAAKGPMNALQLIQAGGRALQAFRTQAETRALALVKGTLKKGQLTKAQEREIRENIEQNFRRGVMCHDCVSEWLGVSRTIAQGIARQLFPSANRVQVCMVPQGGQQVPGGGALTSPTTAHTGAGGSSNQRTPPTAAPVEVP